MKVVMVMPGGRGGLYAYTDALCRGFSGTSVDITVLSSSLWPDLPRPFKVERCFSEIRIPKKRWSKLRWAADRFWKSYRNCAIRNRFAIRANPDVVHLQLGVPSIDQFLLKFLSWRLPLVLTVHDVQPHCDRFNTRRSFLRRFFHIPDRLIVHYDEGKRQLVEYWGISADRIDVIPHGIMPLNRVPAKSEARKELDLPLDRLIILFFGSIRENKGLDILLKALERVRLCKPEALLVVAGAPYRGVSFDKFTEIIEQTNLSDNVRTFIRSIDENDVDLFFAASDLVVLPYIRFESQSGVLLRAYAHKLPVVVTNVGAMGESVSKDKVGLVVKPGNTEEIAGAIVNALSNLAKFRSNYNRELYEKYCWERIARLTMNSYEKALRNRF